MKQLYTVSKYTPNLYSYTPRGYINKTEGWGSIKNTLKNKKGIQCISSLKNILKNKKGDIYKYC
jgi:hypothetical protein